MAPPWNGRHKRSNSLDADAFAAGRSSEVGNMTLERAISMLEAEYEKAQKLSFVHNPIAWALFRVWKVADREGRGK